MIADSARADLARAIALAASREDPSLPSEAGELLALTCLDELATTPDSTPAGLARRVLSQHPDTDPSWANHVARVALVLVSLPP